MERHPLEDQPLWNLAVAIEVRRFTANNVLHFCHWLTMAAEANQELGQRVAELERRATGADERVRALRSGLERIADLGLPPAEEVDGRAEAIAVTTLEADDKVRQPADGFDYEAAHAHADLATGDKVRGGIIQKGSHWMMLFGQHCYQQGLAARLTPEELRATGDAVVHLGAALDGGGLEAEDEVSIRRALPVLQALAGKGAG